MTHISDVVVGQEIGLVRYGRYGMLSTAFGTVVKINGHGHIFVELAEGGDYKLDKHGNSYKSDYGMHYTCPDRLRKDLEQAQKQKECSRTARELIQTTQNSFSGDGRFHVSAERIAELKNIVAKLESYVAE